MKLREMNTHQRAMWSLMNQYTIEMIGGNENALQDYEPEDEDYKLAYNYLHQGHEALAEDIYQAVMCMCESGTNASHARFAGSQFLRDRIEVRLNKWGY